VWVLPAFLIGLGIVLGLTVLILIYGKLKYR